MTAGDTVPTPEPQETPYSAMPGEPGVAMSTSPADARPAIGDLDFLAPEPGDAGNPAEDPARRLAARKRRLLVVRELIETVLLALLVFLFVRGSFQNFVVDGNSMYPTLENGQFLVVNKLVYSQVDVNRLSRFVPFVDPGSSPRRNIFHGPERGDIVVFKDPGKPETDLVKRIIALPGETIEIVDGRVYINDRLLIEPYIKERWQGSKPRVSIPAGEYFVMGDHRSASKDSRSADVGLVPRSLIIGKAMLSYWPPSKFGLAPNESGGISTTEGRPQVSSITLGEMVEFVGRSPAPALRSDP
jgi:signal peptidase I